MPKSSKMTLNSKIFIGSINYDIYKLALGKIIRSPGGSATTTCYYYNMLSKSFQALNEPIYLIGVIGNDENGKILIQNLNNSNIDTNYIKIIKGNTGSTEISLDENNERTIKRNKSVTALLPNYITSLDSEAEDLLKKSDIHVKGRLNLLKAIRTKTNKIYSIDISSIAGDPDLYSWISDIGKRNKMSYKNPVNKFSIKYLFGNSEEFKKLTTNLKQNGSFNQIKSNKQHSQDPLHWFAQIFNTEHIFIKHGKNGASLYVNTEDKLKKIISLPALDVKVKDTTGAGDAFNAGVLFGLRHDFSEENTLKAGIIMGSKNCETFGAQTLKLTAHELKNLINIE